MSSIEKTRRLAAEALGEQVEVAVLAYRYVHPLAVLVAILGVVSFRADHSWVGGAFVMFACWVLYLLTRPTVFLARTPAGIVALRSLLLRPSRPSTHVIERFPAGTPTAIGPASFNFRPLTVSYRGYWVHWRDASAEHLVEAADGRVDRP